MHFLEGEIELRQSTQGVFLSSINSISKLYWNRLKVNFLKS